MAGIVRANFASEARLSAYLRGMLVVMPGFLFVSAAAAEPSGPNNEIWSGVDATPAVWLAYAGYTDAPWSDNIYSDGFRLRSSAGYGGYHRLRGAPPRGCGNPGQDACPFQVQDEGIAVTVTYADALAGYQMRFGELTAKVFIGATILEHRPSQADVTWRVAGQEIGVKGQIELWQNLGDRAWTSLDLSYTTAFDTASLRWRAGWRTSPEFSIGPEIRFDKNTEFNSARGGFFARYEWTGGEFSLGGGFAGDVGAGVINNGDLFGNANLLFHF